MPKLGGSLQCTGLPCILTSEAGIWLFTSASTVVCFCDCLGALLLFLPTAGGAGSTSMCCVFFPQPCVA